jgi:hypothetical protein
MSYATLRPRHDTGVFVMPAGRERLAGLLASSPIPAGDRRQQTVDLQVSRGAAGGPGRSEWTDVRRGADGFRIAVADVPPHAAAPHLTAGGSGAYVVVVSGAVDDDGSPYGPGSLRWCDASDSLRSRAGEGGARLALLQFPSIVSV